MDATVSIHVNVTDKQALWDAAAANAVSTQSHETRADYKAEFGIDEVTTHLRLLLDRSLPPSLGNLGFDVIDSTCQIDQPAFAAPDPEDTARIALEVALNDLEIHPAEATRDETLSTLNFARTTIKLALDDAPENSTAGILYHARAVYRDLAVADGITDQAALDRIGEVASQIRTVLAHRPSERPSTPHGYDHLGAAPFVPHRNRLFVARQERDAIMTFEAYVVAEDEKEAKALADDDQCTWINTGTGELDDRTIEVERIAPRSV